MATPISPVPRDLFDLGEKGRWFEDVRREINALQNVVVLAERSSDPDKPVEGKGIIWQSDGTGLGDDGDIMIGSTAGGVTNYTTLFDHSAGTTWS